MNRLREHSSRVRSEGRVIHRLIYLFEMNCKNNVFKVFRANVNNYHVKLRALKSMAKISRDIRIHSLSQSIRKWKEQIANDRLLSY